METYDTIIIGAGVTGFGAAMYAGRLGLKTLVIGEIPGGTIINTNIVENYPGFKKLTGQELADNIKEHALDYKEFVSVIEDRVTGIEKKSGKFNYFFLPLIYFVFKCFYFSYFFVFFPVNYFLFFVLAGFFFG